MENFKVKVNTAEESKEAQELFFELGGDFCFGGKLYCNTHLKLVTINKDGLMANIELDGFDYKEITLQELRDMVVLKRNKPDDATHIRGDGKIYFYSKSKDFFYQFSSDKEWILSTWMNYQLLPQLKPIEKEMKEFLNTKTYEYKQAHCMFGHSEWLEIPEGAEAAMRYKSGEIEFFKENYAYFWFDKFKEWKSIKNAPKFYESAFIIWQRPTHPEPLPFIDDNPQSLNDQYAEIEQVRQNQKTIDAMREAEGILSGKQLKGVEATLAQRQSEYGSFEDVAFVTENIMATLGKVRLNGLHDLPHTHRMALYMIASKMARIVNGDFNKLDSWHDIGGYAKLIENLIEGK